MEGLQCLEAFFSPGMSLDAALYVICRFAHLCVVGLLSAVEGGFLFYPPDGASLII